MAESGSRIPQRTMIGVSLLQGLMLLLLWRALSGGFWPAGTPLVNLPLWTVALTFPAFLLFALERGNARWVVTRVGAVVGVLALLAVHVGWQATPHGVFDVEAVIGAGFANLVLASFLALIFLLSPHRDYASRFAAAWRSVLIGLFAGALAGGVALLLFLWGALFEAVGVGFFAELFARDWVLFPVLSVAFGIGVSIFRSLDTVIGGIVTLVEGLMRLLLPLGLGVVVIFLAALPFTGLAPLWETGYGTGLLLWLNALAIVFVNGVYQTGTGDPYPKPVHLALLPGMALLPAISALACYGLYLRVAQYGWTVERCWAATVALVLALVSLGYSWSVLRRRIDWPRALSRTNVTMAWVLLGFLLAVNSPLLDFRAVSTASQFGRLDAGEVTVEAMDFGYVSEYLARPGYLATEALLAELEPKDPQLAARIRAWWDRPVAADAGDFWSRVAWRPEPFDVPPALRQMIESAAEEQRFAADRVLLVRVELTGDDLREFLLLDGDASTRWMARPGLCFYFEEGEWRQARVLSRGNPDPGGTADDGPLRTRMLEAFDPPPRRFRAIRAGPAVLEVEYGQAGN